MNWSHHFIQINSADDPELLVWVLVEISVPPTASKADCWLETVMT